MLKTRKIISHFLIVVFALTTILGDVSTLYADSSSYEAVEELFQHLPEEPIIAPKHFRDSTNAPPLDIDLSLMRYIPEEIVIPEFEMDDSLTEHLSEERVNPEFDTDLPLRVMIPINIDSNTIDVDLKEDLLEIKELLSSNASYHSLTEQQKDLIHECVGLPRETMKIFADAGSSISETVNKISTGYKASAEMIESESAEPMDFAISSQNAQSGFIPEPSEFPFYFANSANDGINYSSGALAYEDRIATIPGRNGLDLDLTVRYASDRALTREPSVAYQSLPHLTGYYLVGLRTWFADSEGNFIWHVFDILFPTSWHAGQWMDANRDFIDAIIRSDPNTYSGDYGELEHYEWYMTPVNSSRVLNPKNPFDFMGFGWSFKFPRVTREYENVYLHLADGSAFEYNTSSGPSNLKNRPGQDMVFHAEANGTYTLSYHDGRKELFNDDGTLARITDRFGNEIRFEYTGSYISGNIKITDTNGQVVNIQHTPTEVRVFLPDRPDTPAVTYHINGVLTHKFDQLNRRTNFGYIQGTEVFDIVGEYSQTVIDTYLLDTAAYPTGAVTQYLYRHEDVIGGSAQRLARRYYRIRYRYDAEDGNVNNLLNSNIHNFAEYTYEGRHTDGTGYSTTFKSDYSLEGVMRTYKFHNKHLLTKIETAVDPKTQASPGYTKRQDELFEYDSANHMTRREQIFYNGSIQRRAIELFTYDVYKNLTHYWDTHANGDRDNTLNRTTVTYGAFGIPLTTTYHKDASTQITVTNTLLTNGPANVNGKAIGRTTTTANSAEIQRTDFLTYDTYGNITAKRDYVNNSNNYSNFIQTSYAYAGGVFVSNETIREYASNVATGDAFTREFTYDVFGRPKTLIDGNGNPMSYIYDNIGRLERKTNPGNSFSTIEYNDSARTMTTTDENGHKVKTSYNRFGFPTLMEDITDPNGAFKLNSYTYDILGRVRTEQDWKNTTTVYDYDYLDRVLAKSVDPSGSPRTGSLYLEIYEYNDALSSTLSRVDKYIDGSQLSPYIRTATYTNTHGFTTQTSRWINGIERSSNFTHDFLGNTLTARYSEGDVTYYEYDGLGRLIKTTTPEAQTNSNNRSVYQTTYDWPGRKTTSTDPKGAVSEYQYNALGLLTGESVPFEGAHRSTTTYSYDKNGNMTSQRQSNNKPGSAASQTRTEYEYNNRDFLTKVTSYDKDAVDNSITYTYDNVGNTTSMSTANGTQTTHYEYDKQNRLRRLTDPMGMFEEYTYDNNNNLLTKTDRNKNVATNTYDLLNRITHVSVRHANGSTAPEYLEYRYAATGLKTHERNEKLTIAYEYDDAGRLIKQTETAINTPGANVVKSYSYDNSDNLLAFTLTQNGVTRQSQRYEYDNMFRLWRVFDFNALQATYAYDANGNRQSLVYPNGVTTNYSYNHANLVTNLSNSRGGTVLSGYAYTYLLDGNQDSKTDHEGVQTAYTYDGLGRLVKETELVPAGARGQSLPQAFAKIYSFDTAGNRKNMTAASAVGSTIEQYTVEYEYDKSNRLLKERNIPFEAGPTFETTYSYDPNGNQIQKRVSNTNETETRTYDVFNRLRGVNNGNISAVYTYRPDGLRLSKTAAGLTTTHIWDGGNIIAELDGSGNMTNRFVRGINLIKWVEGASERFYLFNAHGDVVQLTTPEGIVSKNYYYDAFGNEINATNASTTAVQSHNEVQLHSVSSSIDEPLFDWAKEALQAYYKDLLEYEEEMSLSERYSANAAPRLNLKPEPSYRNLEQINPGLGSEGLKGIMATLNSQAAGAFVFVGDMLWDVKEGQPYVDGQRIFSNAQRSVFALTLNGGYTRFISAVRISGSRDSEAEFEVHADGVLKARAVFDMGGLEEIFDIDVSGVRTLQLDMESFNAGYGVKSWDFPILYIAPNPPDNNPFRFSGEYWDDCSQTYYLRSRYYDPRTSRMLSPDPKWNPYNSIYSDSPGDNPMPNIHAIRQSTNLYTYCMNNPVRFIDPWGLDAIYMTYSQGANIAGIKFGHSAIAFQDSKDNWWFMSFEGHNSSQTDIRVYFYQLSDIKWNDNKTMMLSANFTVPDGNRNLFSSFYNTTIIDGEMRFDRKISIYDSQVYIKGDFSQSYDKALVYSQNYPNYLLTGMNCSWLALEVLQVSTMGDIYNNLEHYLWNYNAYGWRLGRNTIRPNNSVKDINRLFGQ